VEEAFLADRCALCGKPSKFLLPVARWERLCEDVLKARRTKEVFCEGCLKKPEECLRVSTGDGG
jgi:hypothetical protein